MNMTYSEAVVYYPWSVQWNAYKDFFNFDVLKDVIFYPMLLDCLT